MSNTHDQVIALAALLQSAYLVDMIATTGEAPDEHSNPLINSLFRFDADSAEDVYDGTRGIQLGLELMDAVIEARDSSQYRSTMRYAMGILYLQRQLQKTPAINDILASRLQHAALKREHFSNSTNEIAHSIAAIYQDTISTFSYRLKVSGDANFLQQSQKADLIRSLLLAGIRAAVLWRQMGGRRRHLFFSRRRLRRGLKELLQR